MKWLLFGHSLLCSDTDPALAETKRGPVLAHHIGLNPRTRVRERGDRRGCRPLSHTAESLGLEETNSEPTH